jgi:N-acetylmuramoyl-L-alanine amidase
MAGFKVAIFPGHIGKDSGAISPVSPGDSLYTLESVLNGQICALLKNQLDQLMIENEIFIGSLEGVVSASVGFSLGVSIHCDAFTDPKSNGATSLYFPESVDGKNLAGLVEMEWAFNLQRIINYRGNVPREDLYVLRKTEFPTVLIECGFISNHREEMVLSKYKTQLLIARAVSNAILRFNG